jgi:hypothetical protein
MGRRSLSFFGFVTLGINATSVSILLASPHHKKSFDFPDRILTTNILTFFIRKGWHAIATKRFEIAYTIQSPFTLFLCKFLG